MRRIRPALPSDARMIWEWANDPETRARSFSPAPIPWESHALWYERRLASPVCRFYVLEADGEPVGQIRYDRNGAGQAVISFSVAPNARRQGHGLYLVAATVREAVRALKATEALAEVFADNEASLRIFRNAGFADHGAEDLQGRPGHRFTWRP